MQPQKRNESQLNISRKKSMYIYIHKVCIFLKTKEMKKFHILAHTTHINIRTTDITKWAIMPRLHFLYKHTFKLLIKLSKNDNHLKTQANK